MFEEYFWNVFKETIVKDFTHFIDKEDEKKKGS